MSSVRYDSEPGQINISSASMQAGALIVEGTPAAFNVVYPYPSGGELRTRGEVASPEALASWKGLPVIVGHEMLAKVDDARAKAVGYVRSVHADAGDNWLHATIVLTDPTTIDNVRAGRLVELSGGYSTDVSHEDGHFDGEKFVGVQRNIIMNHLALGPLGFARGGPDARVR